MRIAIIGRTEMLYNTTLQLHKMGFDIPIIITAKETPEYERTASDFENLAKKIGAKYIYSPVLNKPEVRDGIQSCGTLDLAVSLNFTGIVSQQIIDMFRLGVLNAHGGDLPKYRGNACQAWAMINGEDKIGLCIHKMIGGELDSGKIISRGYLDINLNTRIKQVYDWVNITVGPLFLEAVQKLSENEDYFLETQSTDPKKALRCYPRLPEDGCINFDNKSEEILRLINASSEPYSGAYCTFENKKMIIWRAKLASDVEVCVGIPGQVTRIESDGSIVVLCKESKLRILEIEFENKRCKPELFIKSLRKRLN